MRTTTTSIHHLVSLFLVAGVAGSVAACNGGVDIEQTSGGTGSGGSTSSGFTSTGSSPSSTSTSNSSSSSAGGAGGMDSPACAPGEAAIVIAGASEGSSSAVAVQSEGAWLPEKLIDGGPQTVAYVDVNHRLAVAWVGFSPTGSEAHFTSTSDGTDFDLHDIPAWHPYVSSPLFSVDPAVLVGRDDQGTSLAHYDSGAMSWAPWLSTPFVPSSGATVEALGSKTTVLVGAGPNQELCDISLDLDSAAWGTVKCHPELPHVIGGELPLPQVVALPNGDVVVVYPTSSVELSAVVLHQGQWSKPVPSSSSTAAASLAVTATPSGDVLAGVISTSGEVSSRRFSPGVGWSAPIQIDKNALATWISAAPGICGDDALFAYIMGAGGPAVRVARVRGDATETTPVAHLVESIPTGVSIATRRAFGVK